MTCFQEQSKMRWCLTYFSSFIYKAFIHFRCFLFNFQNLRCRYCRERRVLSVLPPICLIIHHSITSRLDRRSPLRRHKTKEHVRNLISSYHRIVISRHRYGFECSFSQFLSVHDSAHVMTNVGGKKVSIIGLDRRLQKYLADQSEICVSAIESSLAKTVLLTTFI